jgi:hypothetical protein
MVQDTVNSILGSASVEVDSQAVERKAVDYHGVDPADFDVFLANAEAAVKEAESNLYLDMEMSKIELLNTIDKVGAQIVGGPGQENVLDEVVVSSYLTAREGESASEAFLAMLMPPEMLEQLRLEQEMKREEQAENEDFDQD